MSKNARETALLILREIEEKKAYSNLVLKDRLDDSWKAQDKALITELVYGIIRKKYCLDYVIFMFSKLKKNKLSPMILDILRLGVYQILFLARIPQSAACNEAAKLAKRYGHGGSLGFVNGVLRNIAKNKENITFDIEDPVKRLSIAYSFPESLVKMWVSEYGIEKCELLLEAFDKKVKTTIRVNNLVSDMQRVEEYFKNNDIAYEKSVLTKDVLLLERGAALTKTSLFLNGEITLQSEPSMHAVLALSPKPGETVIDLCSAPGGKACYMAELMQNKGRILAFDIHPHRIKLIEKTAQRLGVSIIEAAEGDAVVRNPDLIETADKVLVDVPCSGFGVIGSKPDIKYNEFDFDTLCSLQYNILNNAANYVKKGGRVVYSTCTLNKKENQEIILNFLENNHNFKIEKIFMGESSHDFITFLPFIHHTEGFFICRLIKG